MASFQSETPRTISKKEEAVGHVHLIEAKRSQMMVVYNHLHTIGADKQILSEDKDRNRQLLTKWFQTLVIQNQRFPMDIPVVFVLDEFFRAILQQKVALKGFNLLAHMQAFWEWLDGYEHELRGRWWVRQHPKARPRALPESASRSQQEEMESDEQRRKTLEAMYGADRVPEGLRFWEKDNEQITNEE